MRGPAVALRAVQESVRRRTPEVHPRRPLVAARHRLHSNRCYPCAARATRLAAACSSQGSRGCCATGVAQRQEVQDRPTRDDIAWQAGPGTGQLGNVAQIQIPDGYMFSGRDGVRRFLEMTQNPVAGSELGVLIPPEESGNRWFVIFDFDSVGYIKDDEKDDLDAKAILDSIKTGTERSNEERRKRGKPAHLNLATVRAAARDPACLPAVESGPAVRHGIAEQIAEEVSADTIDVADEESGDPAHVRRARPSSRHRAASSSRQ